MASIAVSSRSTTAIAGISAAAAAFAVYQLASCIRSSLFLPIHDRDAIVVTGADTGIGRHAALSLAKEGFTVFCGVLKLENGNELLRLAAKHGIDQSKIEPILLDVTKPEQIEAAVQHITKFVGAEYGLYGLFNNAGIGPTIVEGKGASVETMPVEDFRRIFEVNYFGLLSVTRAFLPLIRKRKGRIISNSSMAGVFAGPFGSAYSCSKFAVEALMDVLRRELFGLHVSVSILEPGFIRSPIYQAFQNLLDYQGVGVYATNEVAAANTFAKNALQCGASPKVTSKAVVHAMRSRAPKIRYPVGGMATPVTLLSLIPDSYSDFLIRASLNPKLRISEDELNKILSFAKEDEDCRL